MYKDVSTYKNTRKRSVLTTIRMMMAGKPSDASTSTAFLRHNVTLFFGSVTIGFLNYIYYPVLGHLMVPSGFGEVQVLTSLLAQITIFLNVFGLLTVNIVVNYTDVARRNRLVIELERLAFILSAFLLFATILGGSVLQRFFHFGSGWPFVILMLAVVVTVPLTFRNSFLSGRKRFMAVVMVGIVGSVIDLLCAAIFVKLHFGTIGAISGLVIGQLIAFCLAAAFARRWGFSESLRGSFLRLPDVRLLLPELKYALMVLICSLGVITFFSIDTVVVKHYFDAHTAGLYAGIATIARIIFFVTASVAQVLLPSVTPQHSPVENQRMLVKSFVLLSLLGGFTLLIFVLLRHAVIRILMGNAYIQYEALLPRLGFALLIISYLNLFIMYHLALRRSWIATVILVGLVVVFVALRLHHSSLKAVIDSIIAGSASALLVLGGQMAVRRSKLKSALQEV